MNTLIKPALRQLKRYPVFSLINLGGLAIGIAASFILLVYTQRELSTDHHFRDADRIARIGTDFFQLGPFAFSQPMLRPLAIASCKDVEDATGFDTKSDPVRTNRQDRAFTGIISYLIDSSFFHVFSHEAAAGALPQNGLAPGQAILSASQAQKFFGGKQAVGQTIYVGKDLTPYTVVAVLKETFAKSTIDPQLLLPQPRRTAEETSSWWNVKTYNYVKLKPQGSLAGLNAWLERLRQKVVYPASGSTDTYAQWKTKGTSVFFYTEHLTDIYFHSNLKFDDNPGGNLTQVQLLSAISILLILLAIINYINLVTARSSIRAKEIGLKKTFGAPRRTLIAQLLKESLLFSTLAMLLSCGLIQVILFLYQYSTGAALTGPIPFLSANYLWLILFSVAIGLLAGIYPAIYLTGFRAGLTVRSTAGSGRNTPRLRNSLVTLQFAIAIGLLFVSLVVYSQLQYMKNKDKGFRSDGVILLQDVQALNNLDITRKFQTLRHLIDQQSQVTSTSLCAGAPTGSTLMRGSYRTAAMQKEVLLQTFPVDERYITTLGLHLTDGRNFDKNLLSDTNSLILNESAVAAMGLFKPIGALLNGSERVIGVVKDFNYTSLRDKIGPAVLRFSPQGNSILAIHIAGGHPAAFLDWLQQTEQNILPGENLETSFIDDNFGRLAAKEKLLGQAISFFTVLAILLATLGLIGLTLFTIERRTKEIGIRKVLGAGNGNILRLISGNFIRLALIASAIALPLSWWLIHRWLDNFAYRVTINAGLLLLTEGLILSIAFIVIGALTLRALAANPVKNLRTE
ncbi:ABC transporter permease [Puia dinghuensis]|uniref:ABC transporter permease n=1 Tax=Puia dinghuensis TaxID=1792502 RepID=A0A8J2XVI8_9BACT|nr:FtsX-like permease family protein [Puia dinghuensis]GGB15929.1 ABC transporter permease [Puia dinghuensis]